MFDEIECIFPPDLGFPGGKEKHSRLLENKPISPYNLMVNRKTPCPPV